MSITDQLSSSVGVNTQEPNAKVAEKCLVKTELLIEIVEGLGSKNVRLAGDCAEVMTKVAEKRPEIIAPYAQTLFSLLNHKNGRVRWEAAHAFGLVASFIPDLMAKELPTLTKIVRQDKSVIVRDYIIDAIANYGTTSPQAAKSAFPILHEASEAWESKHAARVLSALNRLVKVMPNFSREARELALGFQEHSRAGVRKAAKSLLKTTENI